MNINDLGPENICDLHDFRSGFGVGIDFDEHQLAVDMHLFAKILNLQHLGELVQLAHDLHQSCIVSLSHNRHAGSVICIGRSDIQCVNIEASTTEQAGDSCQNAKLIFNQN